MDSAANDDGTGRTTQPKRGGVPFPQGDERPSKTYKEDVHVQEQQQQQILEALEEIGTYGIEAIEDIKKLVPAPLWDDKEFVKQAITTQVATIFAMPANGKLKWNEDLDIVGSVDIPALADYMQNPRLDHGFDDLPVGLCDDPRIVDSYYFGQYAGDADDFRVEDLDMGEDDLKLVDTAVDHNHNFCHINDVLERCSERVQAIYGLREDASRFAGLSEELRDDLDVADIACKDTAVNLQHASIRVQAVYQMRDNSSGYSALPIWLREDRDVALAAVGHNPELIMQAPSLARFQDDGEFILEAVERQPAVFANAHPSLQSDRLFAWRAVKRNPLTYNLLPAEIQTDPAICLVAAQGNYTLLERMPTSVLKESSFFSRVLKEQPLALKFAPGVVQADKDLVSHATCRDHNALQYAAKSLLTDIAFVASLVRRAPLALQYASEKVRADHDTVLLAARNDAKALQFVTNELLGDRNFVLELAKNKSTPQAFQYASKELRGEKEIVLAFLQNKRSGEALQYAAESLKKNREFLLESMRLNGMALRYVSSDMRADEELVFSAAQSYKYVLREAYLNGLWANANFALKALKFDKSLTYKIDEKLKHDPVFMADAIGICFDKRRPFAFWKFHASKELQSKLRSGVEGLRNCVISSENASGKKITIVLPKLECVARHADQIERQVIETFWLQDQISQALPETVADLIRKFTEVNKDLVERRLQQARDLRFCGPVFVSFSKMGINWIAIP